MTLPLPNWRSIWDRAPCRAVSRALEGSWMLMSTTLGRVPDRRQDAFATELQQICANSAHRDERGWSGDRRQGEPEGRAVALGGGEAHGAAVSRDDLVRQGQAEAGAADVGVRARHA